MLVLKLDYVLRREADTDAGASSNAPAQRTPLLLQPVSNGVLPSVAH